MSNKFIVYGRKDCHLCEDMVTALRDLQRKFQFEFEVVDIDIDEKLVQLYSERVPVLFAVKEAKEVCHYFLDVDVLSHYFS